MKLSYFDIVDQHDNPIGQTASFDEVHAKGLWHRGVHVIIYTPEREIIMQKRSVSLKYHPNEIEISVGGGVDAGETPLQAGVREVQEELGLSLNPADLTYIGKKAYNHRSKTQQMRCFNYSYAVCLPKEQLQQLTIDPQETSLAFMITERKLRRALRIHRIKNIGKITSTYAYWRFLLDGIATA